MSRFQLADKEINIPLAATTALIVAGAIALNSSIGVRNWLVPDTVCFFLAVALAAYFCVRGWNLTWWKVKLPELEATRSSAASTEDEALRPRYRLTLFDAFATLTFVALACGFLRASWGATERDGLRQARVLIGLCDCAGIVCLGFAAGTLIRRPYQLGLLVACLALLYYWHLGYFFGPNVRE